jgi:hypothetical protein
MPFYNFRIYLSTHIRKIPKILAVIAHNVPVVCDVLTASIKELRGNSSGGQNVPAKNRTKGRSADNPGICH